MIKTSRLFAIALATSLSSTAVSAAPCVTTAYADFVPCSVGNVQVSFYTVAPSAYITPFDNGTSVGLSVSFGDLVWNPLGLWLESAFGATPLAGYRLTGASVGSDVRIEGMLPYDNPFFVPAGGVTSIPFNFYRDAFGQPLTFFNGIGFRTYQPTAPNYIDVAFTTAPIAQTPLPAAWLMFASGLGLAGLFGWRRRAQA
jgi:hypothetical protein